MGPARPRQLPGVAVVLAAAGLVGAWWVLVAPVLGQARLDSRAGVALVAVAFGGPAAAFAALATLARPGWARIGSGLLLAPASVLAGIAILPCLLLWSASSSWMAGREVTSRHRLRTFPTWSTGAPGAAACPGR